MSEPHGANARVASRSHRLLVILLSMPNSLGRLLAEIVVGFTAACVLLTQPIIIGVRHDIIAAGQVLLGCMLILSLIIAATILIHELGHVLAAVLVRWRVLQVLALGFTLVRQGDRFSLRRTSKRAAPDGLVIACPNDTRKYLMHAGIFYGGGVIANWLTALVCFVTLLLSPALSTHLIGYEDKATNQVVIMPEYWIATLLQSGIVLNLAYVVSNLIPSQFQHLPSDGKHLLRLLLSWQLGITPTFVTRPGLGGILFHGVRPRKWDPEFVRRLLKPSSDAVVNSIAGLYGYFHVLDNGDPQRAGELLERALARIVHVTGNDRSALLLEAAYFEGFHRRNAATARKWLHQVKVKELQEHTFLRGAAAVLLAEGLLAEAAAGAEAALARTGQSLDYGGVLAEREWLQAILDTCRAGG